MLFRKLGRLLMQIGTEIGRNEKGFMARVDKKTHQKVKHGFEVGNNRCDEIFSTDMICNQA